MNQTFQEFLASQSIEIPVASFIVNLILAAILSFLLRGLYVRWGRSLSNRKSFGRNLILITTTTMLIITVVKSSLALSLGLVGALSIVRFRTAIKEPEELAYLFLAIALGLGLGADQRLVTLIGFVIITAIIWLTRTTAGSSDNQNLYLTVGSHNPDKLGLKDIVSVLEKHCTGVILKRFDDATELLEATFLIELNGFQRLEAVRTDLQSLSDSLTITFVHSTDRAL